jgi:hypothetical protein
MCACTYTPISNTNACSNNASKIEACLSSGEDYPSACAVIESVCIAGYGEEKHNGKGYSKKGYTYSLLHFNSFLPIIIGVSLVGWKPNVPSCIIFRQVLCPPDLEASRLHFSYKIKAFMV